MSDAKERPPGHDLLVGKEPCPKCGSRDNLARYADGHATCFSPGCGHWEPAGGGDVARASPGRSQDGRGKVSSGLLTAGPEGFKDLKARHLQSSTLRRFGYFTAQYNGQGVQVAPYQDQAGITVAQKLRFADKQFPVLKGENYPGTLAECQLFGQHLWGGRDKRLVITEGEIDAMTVAQVMDFKVPVVSVGTGSGGAKKHLQKNLMWLMGFEEIILFFDGDEPGETATQECVTLFQPGKVKVAKMEGFKDANAALVAGRPGDISAAVYGASVYSPPGILSARDILKRVDFDAPPSQRYATPWPNFTKSLYGGISKEDVIFILSGAGKGKSTFLFELISHLEEHEGATVGALFFEDTLTDVAHGLLTVRTSKRLRLDPSLVSSEVKKEEWAKIADSDRLYLFDGENARWGMENLLDYIRYLAKGCGCTFILIDPLSFLIAQSGEKDERRAIDTVVAECAALSKQLGVGIIFTHHLTRPEGNLSHEEGAEISLKQARGSNGIGQFCTLAFGLQWDKQSELTLIKCLKSRKQGELSGKVLSALRYDADTGRVFEAPIPNQEDTEVASGFSAVAGNDF